MRGFLLPVLLWLISVRIEAASIEKLFTFATNDAVRIEAVFGSTNDSFSGEVFGRIQHSKTGKLLWSGSLGRVDLRSAAPANLSHNISGLAPELWSPVSPTLYNLELVVSNSSGIVASNSVRFGFRSFENRGGQFFLNGRPVFLRGLAINPPGRTVPDAVGESREFARAYVQFMREHHFNAIRMTHDSQVWFDVCDELGMMVFQGQYASPREAPPLKKGTPIDYNKSIASYKKLFETYASHPSIVIYILSNELPISGQRGKAFSEFLTRACADLKLWDPTRLYIGNAGYGEGREGDICDVHRYWGWYYNTFLTFMNLRNEKQFGNPALSPTQPLTFTECVGCFTGPNGEFNIITRKQLGAQLNWTGHSVNQREDALEYQSFQVKQVTEMFRRLRVINPHIAGLMPFTIGFANWSGIKSFEEMKPNPSMAQFAVSYQPVLLSWEMWTPQVYAGTFVPAIAHVINDAEDGVELKNAMLDYEVRTASGKTIVKSKATLGDIPYYASKAVSVNFKLPELLATGNYLISGTVSANGSVVSSNQAKLFIARKDWSISSSQTANLLLYDPAGATAAQLKKLHVGFQLINSFADLPAPPAALVLGENSWHGTNSPEGNILRQFVERGGRVLCLRQNPEDFDPSWLPEPIRYFTSSPNAATYPVASRPFRENLAVNPERPNHPVFAGLDRHRLFMWSDYTGWNQSKPGYPQIYPVSAGFELAKPESLAHVAILANYDRGLEGIALCEMFAGKGSVIVSAFDLIHRAGLDPVADRLLGNLVRFAASPDLHDAHPLIDSPIQWGNYASERGLITGPQNGLVVNADWVVPPTDPAAKPLTQEKGEWNTRPSDEFLPNGRSPLGPYGYSTGSSLKDLNPSADSGSGIFWVRVPPGKKSLVTKVRNPSGAAASLDISVNEVAASKPAAVGPHGSAVLRTDLPVSATEFSVRYTGGKKLVLVETAFE